MPRKIRKQVARNNSYQKRENTKLQTASIIYKTLCLSLESSFISKCQLSGASIIYFFLFFSLWLLGFKVSRAQVGSDDQREMYWCYKIDPDLYLGHHLDQGFLEEEMIYVSGTFLGKKDK